MSGDNDVSLDEVMTPDKFNMARLYNSQNSEDDQDDYPPFNNAACEYYEPIDLKSHIRDNIDCKNKQTQSYMHINCRGLSSKWENFHSMLCDIHSLIILESVKCSIALMTDVLAFLGTILLLPDAEISMMIIEVALHFLSTSSQILKFEMICLFLFPMCMNRYL